MADIKISNLVNLAAAADDDELVIVDVSVGITKKIKASDLVMLTLDGKTIAIDGINSNGGAFPFTTSGKVTLSQQLGVPTIDLTGGQIAFPAGAIPSADPNTLDDYEEGEWIPDFTRATPSDIATTITSADYTKIGNRVTISCYITVGVITVQGDGVNRITGMPFTPARSFADVGSLFYRTAFATIIIAECSVHTGLYIMFKTSVNNDSLVGVDWINAGKLSLTLSYEV